MTPPKEKAKELIDKFEYELKHIQKQYALFIVDEMIFQNGELYLKELGDKTIEFYLEKNSYLFKVKKEIEKL